MMRILCFVKLVPDVENFKYDYERNVLVRENVQLVINPEDASSLAFALSLKKEYPDTYIETVSMAPRGVVPHLEDLVRRGVDRATLLSDRLYAGSDTFATSCILGRFVSGRSFDWIFSGTHTLDGGTAHVPPQVAELLGLRQMSNIIDIDRQSLHTETAVVEVDDEEAVLRFGINKPAVLSFQYSTKIKLPYITYEMIDADVSANIHVLTKSVWQDPLPELPAWRSGSSPGRTPFSSAATRKG
ncbi:MAG: electron transfer flavoprotein subunit beta/FixA family protein [Sediminispirochaetaceae bacterium]